MKPRESTALATDAGGRCPSRANGPFDYSDTGSLATHWPSRW